MFFQDERSMFTLNYEFMDWKKGIESMCSLEVLFKIAENQLLAVTLESMLDF